MASARTAGIDPTNVHMKTTLKAVDNAADYAPQILKAEWERVKQGELPFRLARNWVAPSVVVLSLLFIALVLTGKIKV